MDIKTDNDIEANDNPEQPLSTPHFDAAMISQAQQVEPLNAKDQRPRPGSAGNFFRGRLAVLAVILVVLLLGAAAVGMVLGFRDRQSAVAEPATANQATPAPTDTEALTPVVKAPVVAPTPARVTRAQRAEVREPEPKLISPERVRRTVQVGIDDIDQALSPKGQKQGQKPVPRKVGELFGRDDRRTRKGKSKHRDDDLD
jgi:hypothetical protein